jgi:hypothetical protein
VDVLMVSWKEVRPGRMEEVSLRSANWTVIPRARQMVDTLLPVYISSGCNFSIIYYHVTIYPLFCSNSKRGKTKAKRELEI